MKNIIKKVTKRYICSQDSILEEIRAILYMDKVKLREYGWARIFNIIEENNIRHGDYRINYVTDFIKQQGLNRANLQKVKFLDLDLSNFIFSEADLSDTYFWKCNLSSSNLSSTNIYKAKFIGCKMSDVDISGASGEDITFKGCNMNGSNLATASIINSQFDKNDLIKANFNYSILANTELHGCNLKGASFTYAHMGNVTIINSILDRSEDFSMASYTQGLQI